VVLKVKNIFMAEKALKKDPDTPMNAVTDLTDDDEIPLNLFDFVLAGIQNKQNEKKQTIMTFL